MRGLSPAAVGPESMLAVMSEAPVLNAGTRFTSVMSAAAGHYETLVRVAQPGADGAGTVSAARFLMQRLVRRRPPQPPAAVGCSCRGAVQGARVPAGRRHDPGARGADRAAVSARL
jgi:hypothetical protein